MRGALFALVQWASTARSCDLDIDSVTNECCETFSFSPSNLAFPYRFKMAFDCYQFAALTRNSHNIRQELYQLPQDGWTTNGRTDGL